VTRQNPGVPNDKSRWLNQTTVGISLASLLSDVSHELASAVLPAFLLTLGAGPAALGWIEGSADGLSAVARLWGGVASDRLSRRKPLASIGYLVTGLGTAAIGICTSAWQVLACRVVAWIGRGSRGPARDVLMAEAVAAEAHGRAFGMERGADALGAVLGPLLALLLLSRGVQPGRLMLTSVVPGLLAFLAMAFLVLEGPHLPRREAFRLRSELAGTGRPFQSYLTGILAFGCGDFSRTLLILHATQHMAGALFSLRGAAAAVALYVIHNAVSALVSFPIGALADRVGHRRVVVGGYLFAAATTAGFALAPPTPSWLLFLFACSGTYIASEEVAEKSYAASLLPKDRRGAGMGLLAATNGIGDMISSALIGTLWSLLPSPSWGFGVAAALQLTGALRILGGEGGVSNDADSG
jgi:MFS family permease